MHVNRRGFLGLASLSTLGLSTYRALAIDALNEIGETAKPARRKSLILLWLDGGPSQLETFDPHPGKTIAGPTKAVNTNVHGVQFAEGLPQLAEHMDKLAIIRSMISTELDHDRGIYMLKTGYALTPTFEHPSLGAMCSAFLPELDCELPGYISILPGESLSPAGYLGESHRPFSIGDPKGPPRNLSSQVAESRFRRRIETLRFVDRSLAERTGEVAQRLANPGQLDRILRMMTSAQARAFRVDEEPAAVRAAYGDTPFGRACLAARRLVEVGVRCVEIPFGFWDSHSFNFQTHARLNSALDPAFATLLRDLKERDLLDSTLVVCTGEFGRTPKILSPDGRDHWGAGFSVALAGGGIRGGTIVGATDPDGVAPPQDPVKVPDLFATVLTSLGIDPATERVVRQRPVKLSEGKPLEQLLQRS